MADVAKLTAKTAGPNKSFPNFFKQWEITPPLPVTLKKNTTKWYLINQDLSCNDLLYLYISAINLQGGNIDVELYRTGACVDLTNSESFVPIAGSALTMVPGVGPNQITAIDYNITDWGASYLAMKIDIGAITSGEWNKICLNSKSRR